MCQFLVSHFSMAATVPSVSKKNGTVGCKKKKTGILQFPHTTERSKSLSIKWVMIVETNVVGLQHIWRVFI
jgi:Cu2+-containing amine oxidase